MKQSQHKCPDKNDLFFQHHQHQLGQMQNNNLLQDHLHAQITIHSSLQNHPIVLQTDNKHRHPYFYIYVFNELLYNIRYSTTIHHRTISTHPVYAPATEDITARA